MIEGVLALTLALAAAPAPDVTSDRMRVLGTDILTGQMIDYCRQRAPARAEAAGAAWQKWRGVSQMEAIRAALGADTVARAEAGFANNRPAVEQKMASLGTPDAQCAQVPAMFTQGAFDMHALYPRAYPVEASQTAPAAQPVKAPVEEARPLAPGQGLTTAKIETIVSSFHFGYEGVQYTLFENGFLLLKDGTVRHDLPPVGPRDFDVAADKAKSPGLWGRWEKRGPKYVLHFSADKGFVEPDGAEVHGPSPAGQMLNANYESASGYQFIGGGGSFSFHHMVFRKDGRFTRANSGFTGGTVGTGATTIAAGTSWNDKGKSTTITGAGAAVRGGIIDRRGTPDADLQGTYHIDGYQLDLTFDSGRHESHFFYVTQDHGLIGLDNGTMIIPH